MSVVINRARQSVSAPARKPRRYGLFSVADIVDGGELHWILGGLTADGEECSAPMSGEIVCGPSDPKVARSWYSDIDGDPWLAYMYETCKTVGRYDEAESKVRERFLAAEQSAVERGFQQAVLNDVDPIGNYASVPTAIGAVEALAADQYGGQVILHMTAVAANEATSKGLFERVGDHLETVSGNLVSVGNYADDAGADAVTIWATGATTLYRSDLVTPDPTFIDTNDYFVLVERAYAALVDCFSASATGVLCSCGDPAPFLTEQVTITSLTAENYTATLDAEGSLGEDTP